MASTTIYPGRFFVVGGTLGREAASYIQRPADDDLFRLTFEGQYCNVLAARQTGKSSLMVRTAEKLKNNGVKPVIIDLTSIGSKVSADEWFFGLISYLNRDFNLNIDEQAWWHARKEKSPVQRFNDFLLEVILKEIQGQIVIFIDEIDSTLKLEFTDDFFAAIRAVYNARSQNADLKRLTFVLLGVARPSDLIKDHTRTPYNIGVGIDVTDFQIEELDVFESVLEKACPGMGRQVLEWVLEWTDGQPYLTQKLSYEVVKQASNLFSKDQLDNLVEQLFLGEKARTETNLRSIRDQTSKHPRLAKMLRIYRRVLANKQVLAEERSIEQNELKLTGLVKTTPQGTLQVRNRIYAHTFNDSWAQENIPKNWAKITSVAFGLLSFVLLSIFIYDSVMTSRSYRCKADFYTTDKYSEKLRSLVCLFEIEGIFQNTDYDFMAREIFYNLDWDQQVALFNDPLIHLPDKQKYLPTVVSGLYVTMANIEGEEDSTELLGIMKDSLTDVNSPESKELQKEIFWWLEARSASTNQQKALDNYIEAVKLNKNNPATLYEHARIALQKGLYEEALSELDTTLGLAQNLSSENPEPPKKPEFTQPVFTQTPTIETQYIPTQTFFQPNATATVIEPSNSTQVTNIIISPTNPDIITGVPFAPEQTPTIKPANLIRKGYRSNFYTNAGIRNAVDLILKSYTENRVFVATVQAKFSSLTNLSNAGLIGKGFEATVPIVICTPDSPLVNVYNAAAQPWANAIFEAAFPSYIPTPIPPNPSSYNEEQILSARYTAFLQLIKETTRWSDTKRINLQDSSEAMITLTYISPELVQAVFLNKVLKDRSLTYDFQNQLRNMLNSIAARNELLFLLTVTTTNNNINQTPHTIEIPIEGMVLNNAKNLTVTHSHNDQNLEQIIDTSSDPVFGYLAYPLALVSETQCEWVLDPKYNTNIVVAVPYITVDDVKSNSSYVWTIPYAPLINLSTPSNTPVWSLPPGYDQNLMTPFASPPKDINQSSYWQDFARFVWNQITLGNY